jgi:hypothetical protein
MGSDDGDAFYTQHAVNTALASLDRVHISM